MNEFRVKLINFVDFILIVGKIFANENGARFQKRYLLKQTPFIRLPLTEKKEKKTRIPAFFVLLHSVY